MNRAAALPAVPLIAAAVLLAGCGGGATPATASGTAAASSTTARGRPGGGGLSGIVASVGSGTFSLHAASGGTATVDYSDRTVFDKTSSGGLGDVAVGSCVAVAEAAGSDPSTGSVDASTVRISAPVDGACTGGFGRGAGAFPSGGSFPSGAAGRRGGAGGSSGGGGFGNRGSGLVAGTVASVSGSGFDVTETTPSSSGGSASTTTMAVTVSPATRYTVTSAASGSDLAVGECARVFAGGRRAGASGSAAPPSGAPSGPVTAMSVTLSAAVNGSCPVVARRSGGGGA